MKLFFDFDDVLFHTAAFVQEKKHIFLRSGISEELYLETYSQSKTGNLQLKAYDFSLHLTLLKDKTSEDKIQNIREEMKALFERSSEFVFSDVINALQGLKDEGYDLYLVSFGDIHFQQQKIIHSGLVPFFRKIMIGRHAKSELMKDVYTDNNDMTLESDGAEKSWFIDDQPYFLDEIKAQYPQISMLQMMRSEGRLHQEEVKNTLHQKVYCIDDVLQIARDVQ